MKRTAPTTASTESSTPSKKQRLETLPSHRGQVRCNKLPNRFASLPEDRNHPQIEGFKNINVCSGSPSKDWRTLSPMLLGPIEYQFHEIGDEKETHLFATNLENLWQFSKVWPGEEDAKTKLPSRIFFTRRQQGWLDKKAHRRVKPGAPLYSYFKGEKLNYLEARRKIYCPLYASLVEKTPASQKLYKMVHEQGQNIQTLGYDGYAFSGKTLRECFLDTSRPFGHELVLVCLLLNDRVWEQ